MHIQLACLSAGYMTARPCPCIHLLKLLGPHKRGVTACACTSMQAVCLLDICKVFYDTPAAPLPRSFLGESMDPESTMVYAYYKDGGSSPTFLFCKYALDAVKM